MNILGVRIDNFSKKEILEKVESFLSEEKFHQIATVNPEFILQTQNDEEFKNILNCSDLNVADGIGLKYAFIRYGSWLKERIAGVDLVREILKIANEKEISVFLAINKSGLSSLEEIKCALEKLYPRIIFSGSEVGPNDCPALAFEHPTILFCNLGAPFQERFIFNQKSAKIRLAMGVGGSFDFVTKKLFRAPAFVRKIGLEWLWRFAQEPKYRGKRIFNAVVKFPFLILKNKYERTDKN